MLVDFYLLDVDNSKSHELGLTVFHNLFFEDKSTPEDMLTAFNAVIENYAKFKQT